MAANSQASSAASRAREFTCASLQGILHPEDAELAVAAGVDGIVVSNHGGRQLDTAIAGADALPAITAAVRGRVPVIVDGGVRRGSDVLKALALGADAVMLGRPVLYALARGGQRGVEEALRLLRRELRLCMTLAGCADIGAVTGDIVRRAHDLPERSKL